MTDAPQRTRLNRRWLIKMAAFFVLLTAFGAWGAYDAFVLYPARGKWHAAFTLREYLAEAARAGTLRRASVDDPAAELARLEEAERQRQLTPEEQAKLVWLTSLSRIADLEAIAAQNAAQTPEPEPALPSDLAAEPPAGALERLDPVRTEFADPAATLYVLTETLQNHPPREPLSVWDIPSQYVIMIVSWALALWVLFVVLRASARKYSYDPATHTLTLPDGTSFTPDQLLDTDRRKWDKFFLFIKVEGKPGEYKLDLLRYVPLEDWILEMERLSPHVEAPEPEAKDEPAPADEPQTAEAGSGEEPAERV